MVSAELRRASAWPWRHWPQGLALYLLQLLPALLLLFLNWDPIVQVLATVPDPSSAWRALPFDWLVGVLTQTLGAPVADLLTTAPWVLLLALLLAPVGQTLFLAGASMAPAAPGGTRAGARRSLSRLGAMLRLWGVGLLLRPLGGLLVYEVVTFVAALPGGGQEQAPAFWFGAAGATVGMWCAGLVVELARPLLVCEPHRGAWSAIGTVIRRSDRNRWLAAGALTMVALLLDRGGALAEGWLTWGTSTGGWATTTTGALAGVTASVVLQQLRALLGIGLHMALFALGMGTDAFLCLREDGQGETLDLGKGVVRSGDA